MEIQTSHAQEPNRLPPSEPPGLPEQALTDEQALVGMAAAFSRLVYLDFDPCREHLEELGAKECTQIRDTISSTVAYAFVLEGRAWIVFRGSNDLNDWARNLVFVPFHHLGFRACYADVRGDLMAWVEQNVADETPLCLTGHSLGGALAALATDELATRGRQIEALCTFGAPRAFSPRGALAFDRRSANLPGEPDKRLHDVTHRFRNGGEAVTQVPPFVLGFRHLGRLRDRRDFVGPQPLPPIYTNSIPPLATGPVSAGKRFENALDAAGQMSFGGIEVLFRAMAWGIGRTAYHSVSLYGREVGADAAIAIDWARLDPYEPIEPRTRKATYVTIGFFAALVIALLAALGWAMAAALGDNFLGLLLMGVLTVGLLYLTSDR